jgi:tetratricopeptide (TPR) repeat protein
VAALSPVGTGMGRTDGYVAADYLVQHATRERRYTRLPPSTWEAALSHVHDPADITRLADSARDRLLYRSAALLYQRAADAGDEGALKQLVELLARQGDLDGAVQLLRARADVGDAFAAGRLAELLAEQGDVDELIARINAGDGHAAWHLAELLARQGRREEAERLRRFGLHTDGSIA